MSRQTRRTFLKSSLAAGALFTISGTKSSGNVLGANDRVRVGVAGVNGRGKSHISELVGLPNVEISYIIDPDTRLYPSTIKNIETKGKNTPTAVQDIRRALDDKNLDAVTVATPNHWHSLITIWACQAGKDVYVEKPCSHNVHEGRIAVETARKHNRIVQHGTQSRSSSAWASAVDFIASGKAGKLQVARALCYKRRKSIDFKPTEAPPAELDFNLWLGPAPNQEFHRNLVHYNWHWFWDTGNGDIGNQGVHQMDIARWGIPGATLPKSVISIGGRFGYKDQGQTANTQISVMDFGGTQLIFEVRGLETDKYLDQAVGNIFHCENGNVIGNKFYPKGSNSAETLPSGKLGPGKGHFDNFIAAVRSRRKEDQNADILEGHYSSALCHLANMSYQLGEAAPFNPQTKAFGDNKEAYETLERMEQHLTGNGLNLGEMQCMIGRKLMVDAKTESIIGDSQASQLLTRNYRAPFVVPEKVA